MGLGALLPSLFGAVATAAPAAAVTGATLTGVAAPIIGGATISAASLGALAGPAGIISAATPGIALSTVAAPVAAAATTATALSALRTGFGVIQGISSITGGIQAQAAAEAQSATARILAQTQAAERGRLAAREARVETEEAGRLARRQKLAFLASGVTLSGSPLLVLEETRRKGLENVEEILRAGGAAEEAITAEGRLQATQLERAGRQEFISGLTTGIGSLAEAVL